MTPLLRRHLPASARAVTVAVVALILTAAPAGAAPLTRATMPLFSISCTELAGPSATAALSADQQGVDEQASVAVWAPGSSTEDPAQLVSAGFTLARDDNAVTGTLPMVDADTGEDVGEASFSVALDPVGEPVVGDSAPVRFGNIVDRGYRSEQDAVVSGLLQLPDGSQFALDSCTGTVGEIVIVHNTPRMAVEHPAPQTFGFCVVPGAGGHTLAVLLLVEHDETFAEVALLPPAGEEPLLSGFDVVTLGRTALTGTVPLFAAGGEPAGEAVIAASVEAQRPRIDKGREGDINFKTFVRDFTVRGDVAVTGFGTFALDGACDVSYQRGFLRYPIHQP